VQGFFQIRLCFCGLNLTGNWNEDRIAAPHAKKTAISYTPNQVCWLKNQFNMEFKSFQKGLTFDFV
jgi:hypothetical protein